MIFLFKYRWFQTSADYKYLLDPFFKEGLKTGIKNQRFYRIKKEILSTTPGLIWINMEGSRYVSF